jgi:hypothetical protein
MTRTRIARSVAQLLVVLGILLSMLLAGGAPVDFGNRVPPTPTAQ